MLQAPIRLALIGVGRWGKKCLQTVRSLPQARLTGVASRNPSTAELVPDNCDLYENWEDLIANGTYDGMIIATPPATHLNILNAAICSGKPVLVEKPVCLSTAEAEKIKSVLRMKSANILVDHTHLFHPAFRELQRRAQHLGAIVSISSSAGNYGPFREDISALWDWAPHDLAMCLTLIPGAVEPLRAKHVTKKLPSGALAEDIAIELRLSDGVPGNIHISTMADQHRWFAAEFRECKLVYRDHASHSLVELPANADVGDLGRPIKVEDERPLTRAILDLCHLVRHPTGDRTSIDLGLSVVELIAKIAKILN
jgi:predicted dehydrogenase